MSWWQPGFEPTSPAYKLSVSPSFLPQTMSVSYVLPLKAPSPLPASGVDITTFKVWKNTLVAHIQQDANHYHFMPGGKYATWQAADLGHRILVLHDNDPDKVVIDNKRNQDAATHAAELEKLLLLRNAQLAKFVTHIATLCHYTENDDVTNHSTSLEWIFEYLRKHYGLMTKGANFMNISEHIFKTGTPHQTFYKQYRASFVDNLRKRGDRMLFKNNLRLEEDEKLSPSFENAIVLWTLEKIDPRLPSKVKKDYGHQMTGDTTLKDLQPVIFENITTMIDDLDQAQTTKAFAAQVIDDDDEPTLNVLSNRNRDKFRNSRSLPFKQRPSNRNPPFKNTNQRNQTQRPPTVTDKFCRMCNLAGSDPRIYTSHEIGNCSRLTMRDMESMRNALVLNGMITETNDEPTEPGYVLQPGWDDEEALQYQHADTE